MFTVRCWLGLLLILFAALLLCSQTMAVVHFSHFEGDFARRYAIESSVENYGFSLISLIVGVMTLRSSSLTAACAALAVATLGLWRLVLNDLWLHYVELPHKYPGFVQTHPYFIGNLWMLYPRFLWHVLLPVAAVLSVINAVRAFRGRARNTDPPAANTMKSRATR